MGTTTPKRLAASMTRHNVIYGRRLPINTLLSGGRVMKTLPVYYLWKTLAWII